RHVQRVSVTLLHRLTEESFQSFPRVGDAPDLVQSGSIPALPPAQGGLGELPETAEVPVEASLGDAERSRQLRNRHPIQTPGGNLLQSSLLPIRAALIGHTARF